MHTCAHASAGREEDESEYAAPPPAKGDESDAGCRVQGTAHPAKGDESDFALLVDQICSSGGSSGGLHPAPYTLHPAPCTLRSLLGWLLG